MKFKTSFVIILCFFCTMLVAQKEFNIWPLGRKDTLNTPKSNRNYILDFNSLPPHQYIIPDLANISLYYSIYSDPISGELIFFSNGMRILDKNANILPNCDSINFGENWISRNLSDDAHPTVTNGYFIPISIDSFYFIHQQLEKPINAESPGIDSTHFTLLVNNGSGFECVVKNVLVRYGAMLPLDIVKHGNGKDWWLIIPEWGTNVFSKYIIQSGKILWHDDQTIGYPISDHLEDGGGLNIFNKQGNRYSYHNHFIGNQVFDFDRCTGQFSNPVHIPSEYYYPGGRNVFSPNGRFLYVTMSECVLQYDLEFVDVAASVDTVAVWDYHACLPDWPYSNGFFSATLGPDDKIYISSWSSNNCLTVINRPDLKGMACDVRQHGIVTLGTLHWGLPGYINYQLGPLKGSPCDPDER